MRVSTDRIENDIQDLKMQMTNVEEGLLCVNRRLDRTDQRLLTIEKASASWGITEALPKRDNWPQAIAYGNWTAPCRL
jgi:hypothetical protein